VWTYLEAGTYTVEDNIQLVSYKAKRNKCVILLSSQHSSSTVENTALKKPLAIADYNTSKFGVDVMDQMVANYTVKYKSRRWHVTVFCNILDISCINAYVLHKEVFPKNNANKSHRRRLFLLQLAEQLTAPYRHQQRDAKVVCQHFLDWKLNPANVADVICVTEKRTIK